MSIYVTALRRTEELTNSSQFPLIQELQSAEVT